MKKLIGDLYMEGESVNNFDEGSDREQLQPGAYICEITSAKDVEDKGYIRIEFDIAEGEHKGYFKRLCDRANFWGGNVNLSYNAKNDTRSFKLPCKVINACNPGYTFNPYGGNSDEKTLIGKKIGVILHEEEYKSNRDGSIRTSMKTFPWALITLDKVKSGDFNKKLLDKVPYVDNEPAASSFLDIPEAETPFN